MSIIRVNFEAKQVVENSNYTMEEILNAARILESFLKEDLVQKERDISSALQVMDHDLEGLTDEELDSCDAVSILKRRRAMRQSRRKIKNLNLLKNRIIKNMPSNVLTSVVQTIEAHLDKAETGSSDKFFDNVVARNSTSNTILIKSSRIVKIGGE